MQNCNSATLLHYSKRILITVVDCYKKKYLPTLITNLLQADHPEFQQEVSNEQTKQLWEK